MKPLDFAPCFNSWTIYDSEATYRAALPLARGTYQRDLLNGEEAWSGSTLKGKAKQYGGRYAESRRGLRARLEAAGFVVEVGPRERARRHYLQISAG